MAVQTPAITDSEIQCPDFTLPSVTDKKLYSLSDFKNDRPFLVMFICNHCPYVKAIEDRLIELALDLKKISVHVIAICSNDAAAYPEDSFENLQKRALEKNYPFFYLHDKNQAIAKKFGAVCTPDFFVYSAAAKLSYRGRLDDSWKDPAQVTSRDLYLAILELLDKKPISRPQISSMGCSIKWIQ